MKKSNLATHSKIPVLRELRNDSILSKGWDTKYNIRINKDDWSYDKTGCLYFFGV